MLSLLLIAVSIYIYLKLSRLNQFIFLSLSAFLPFTFGNLRSIPNFQFIEWITIVTFLLLIYELAPVISLEKRINYIRFNGIGLFILAIGILFIWTMVSLINHEIFPEEIIHYRESGTKRIYFGIFNNIILFFTTAVFAYTYFKEIDFEKYFTILLYSSLVIGFLRIFAYFLDIEIPFLSTLFNYGGEFGVKSKLQYGGVAFRLGGLTDIVIFGLPSLFALSIIRQKINFIALIILLFFLFMSGGRTVLIGVFFSIFLFSFLFYPRYFLYLFVAGVAFTLISVLVIPDTVIQGQLGRLTHFNEGKNYGQDDYRGLAWKLYMENFHKNVLFGKGISAYDGNLYFADLDSRTFAISQQTAGGHGSYLSLLSTLGIGGILYFVIMIFGSLYLAFKKIRAHHFLSVEKLSISVFVFMLLSSKSVDYITGGNGLSVPIIFFTAGLIASIYFRSQNLEDDNIDN